MAMTIVFLMAVLGFVASVATHVSTFLGFNPERQFPAVWLLHLGIFVVWGPMLFFLNRDKRAKDEFKWNDTMRYSPRWMKVLCIVLVVHCFVNLYFVEKTGEGGGPGIKDGKKALESHGRLIRYLSDDEFELQEQNEFRGFSGWWMVFYSLGMMVMYSLVRGKSQRNTEPQDFSTDLPGC